MRFFVRLTVLLIAATAMMRAAERSPNLPLRDGERLTYRVSWAVVPGAGEIKIEANHDTTAEPRLAVTTTTATKGIARWLLAFDAQSESVFDLKTGQLVSLHEKAKQRDETTEHTVTFDYSNRTATYTAPAEAARTLTMPPGDPVDLIMGLLQTRSWDMKEGDTRDSLVLFKDDFYELTIHAARFEKVQTSLGSFNTLVLEPRMDKTPPKGMFKRGSSVRVWISQDERRLPVRFEVEFNIGTGTATLESYTGPVTASVRSPSVTTDAKNSRP